MTSMEHFKGWNFKGITETYISGQKNRYKIEYCQLQKTRVDMRHFSELLVFEHLLPVYIFNRP